MAELSSEVLDGVRYPSTSNRSPSIYTVDVPDHSIGPHTKALKNAPVPACLVLDKLGFYTPHSLRQGVGGIQRPNILH